MKSIKFGNVDVYFCNNSIDQDHLSLYLVTDDEGYPAPWCRVTYRINGYVETKDTALVKNWKENEGLDKWLKENGFAVPTGRTFRAGFVIIPEYKFNLEKVNEYLWE